MFGVAAAEVKALPAVLHWINFTPTRAPFAFQLHTSVPKPKSTHSTMHIILLFEILDIFTSTLEPPFSEGFGRCLR